MTVGRLKSTEAVQKNVSRDVGDALRFPAKTVEPPVDQLARAA